MKTTRTGQILALACGLTACGGGPARGQSAAPTIRPNIYEVPPEQVLRAQEAQEQVAFIEVSGSASVTVPTDEARVAFAMETSAGSANISNCESKEAWLLSSSRG